MDTSVTSMANDRFQLIVQPYSDSRDLFCATLLLVRLFSGSTKTRFKCSWKRKLKLHDFVELVVLVSHC